MKHLKNFNKYNESVNPQDKMDKAYHDPVVGDIVYVNYKIPGGNKDHVQTPVKIVNIKGSGSHRGYIGSHNVEMSNLKNAPDFFFKRSDIIGPYKGVNTPVGPGWVSSRPNFGDRQVSNDMSL